VELGVEGDFADLVAFAVDTQQALASGSAHVVDVEADDFGDAGAGVERDGGNRPVAAGQPGFNGAQPSGGGAVVQGARRGGGQVDPLGAGRAEAAAGIEVVDAARALLMVAVARLSTVSRWVRQSRTAQFRAVGSVRASPLRSASASQARNPRTFEA
jgi:hypothetical protein